MSVIKPETEIIVTHAQLILTMQSSTVPVTGVHLIQRLQKGPSHLQNVVIHFPVADPGFSQRGTPTHKWGRWDTN